MAIIKDKGSNMTIQCHNITIKRGKHTVISELNFQQDTPQLIGVIGPNGAGKTTLIRALAGVQPIHHGELLINGMTPQDSTTALAKVMAYLPQQRTVHWDLSIQEVVMLGRLPHQQTFQPPSDEDKAIVAQAMKTMDVAQFVDRSFEKISGGEQARVLIARALAQQPQLLLADEPTNGLDPAHQIRMMKTFQQIVDSGCTVLVSLHDLNLAARYCDRILLLHEGQLAHDDLTAAVLTTDNLRETFAIDTAINQSSGSLSIDIIDNIS